LTLCCTMVQRVRTAAGVLSVNFLKRVSSVWSISSCSAAAAAAAGRGMLSDAPLDLMCWSLLRMLVCSGAGLRRVAVLLERGGVGLLGVGVGYA
jgi:hypothetical protein